MNIKANHLPKRRALLKISVLAWSTPIVTAVVLPAHAQMSGSNMIADSPRVTATPCCADGGNSTNGGRVTGSDNRLDNGSNTVGSTGVGSSTNGSASSGSSNTVIGDASVIEDPRNTVVGGSGNTVSNENE